MKQNCTVFEEFITLITKDRNGVLELTLSSMNWSDPLALDVWVSFTHELIVAVLRLNIVLSGTVIVSSVPSKAIPELNFPVVPLFHISLLHWRHTILLTRQVKFIRIIF